MNASRGSTSSSSGVYYFLSYSNSGTEGAISLFAMAEFAPSATLLVKVDNILSFYTF